MFHFSSADLLDETSSLHQLQPPARLALIGTPVCHSKSPEIHNKRIKKEDLRCHYVAIDVKPEELTRTLEFLRQSRFIGFNITMPHKQQALALMDEITDHAGLLGAINTVVIRDGKFFGSNTDGPGFVAALKERWNLSLQGLSILILGATGGTGRALAMQSALEGCRQLFLASRNPATLQEEVNFLKKRVPHLLVEAILLDEPSLFRVMPHVNLIVNTTPVGLQKSDTSLIPPGFFRPHQFLYDTIYSVENTALMKAAKAGGAHCSNGYSMLLHQGALSFEEWFK